ncbi:GIY-YIG nuclease family protein, partial [Xanthomonas campestris]|uniref:GIY-YIG nuclease family protein n=1 Tax=Xanthomonas campestris TaxID=339 RepID=UPI004039BA70
MESGIYVIINTKTNKHYVGSAVNFEERWKRHFKELEGGNHHSIKLQRSYNKHGKDAFVCKIVEELPYEKSIIVERENYWMNEYNSKENGYNIADASCGDTLSQHPRKQEMFDKISNTIKNNNSKLSPEELKQKHGRPRDIKGKTIEEHYGLNRAIEISKKFQERNSVMNMKGSNNPYYGQKHTDDVRKRISDSQRGKKKPHLKVSI